MAGSHPKDGLRPRSTRAGTTLKTFSAFATVLTACLHDALIRVNSRMTFSASSSQVVRSPITIAAGFIEFSSLLPLPSDGSASLGSSPFLNAGLLQGRACDRLTGRNVVRSG